MLKLASLLFLLLVSCAPASAQMASVITSEPSLAIRLDSELPPPPPPSPASIVAAFVRTETQVRDAMNQHTFKRDVVLQTIGPNGEVTGEYIRNSQFLFDDKGNRIERVLYHPHSTISEMRITKEDIRDLAGAQLLGIDITEKGKYQLTYVGSETLDSREVFAIDVVPSQTPDPNRMKERFFVGRVWVDANTFLIVKVKGRVEPEGKQRFPVFQTWREAATESLMFPSRTEADDTLRFPMRDVQYRIRVKYYNYKRFASRVNITEIAEASTE